MYRGSVRVNRSYGVVHRGQESVCRADVRRGLNVERGNQLQTPVSYSVSQTTAAQLGVAVLKIARAQVPCLVRPQPKRDRTAPTPDVVRAVDLHDTRAIGTVDDSDQSLVAVSGRSEEREDIHRECLGGDSETCGFVSFTTANTARRPNLLWEGAPTASSQHSVGANPGLRIPSTPVPLCRTVLTVVVMPTILDPLRHVPEDVMKTERIGLERAHRRGPPVTRELPPPPASVAVRAVGTVELVAPPVGRGCPGARHVLPLRLAQ